MSLHRYYKLLCMAISWIVAGGITGIVRADASPNIVWIIADDLSPDLGCYGYAGVDTPHIDKLAKQGCLYRRAFATAPVCSSSRSALITGVFQTTTGTHHHRTRVKQPLPAPVVPITELLREAGYFVCNCNSTMRRPGKTDYNFARKEGLYDGVDWAVVAGGRRRGQPFFAQVQIHEPHRNFVLAADSGRAANADIPPYYPTHPVIHKDWANYLASVETLDHNVGKVLERLDDEGLSQNTIVFFFGDHGRPHYRDKQWLYDGGIQVPLLVRWPPKMAPGETSDKQVSLLDVSAATLAAAGVALPDWIQGQDMLNPDFSGRDRIFAARDRCGSTQDRIRCVRTPQYKFIRNYFPDLPYWQHSGYKELQYPGMAVARVLKSAGTLPEASKQFWQNTRPPEELYDLTNDPYELVNLANNPKFRTELANLRRELDDWILHTDDRGEVPEEDVQETLDASDNWYAGQMQKRGLPADISPQAYLRWWEQELKIKTP